jgi:hypothetical protein
MKELEDYLNEFLEGEVTLDLKMPVKWRSPLDIELTPRAITVTHKKEHTLKSTQIAPTSKKTKTSKSNPIC